MSNISTVIQAIIHKSDNPVSGYDIAKIIKSKTGNSHQQIYRELGKLAKRNDVIVTEVPQDDKPDKKLYEFVKSNSDLQFVWNVNQADFSKDKLGYTLLVNDLICGTDYFDSYIDELNEVANKYMEYVK